MIYTIEPKAITQELIERGDIVEKRYGGVVYLSLRDAKDALRASRGIIRVRVPGLRNGAELEAGIYGVDATEADTVRWGRDEVHLKTWKRIVEVEGE